MSEIAEYHSCLQCGADVETDEFSVVCPRCYWRPPRRVERPQAAEAVSVGQVWRGKVGKAPVRIGRVWSSDSFCGGGTFVRCHPIYGGKVWFSTIEEFLKRYEEVSP